MNKKMQIQFILQGSYEICTDYQDRLMNFVNNTVMQKHNLTSLPILAPTAASDGRMNIMISWFEFENKENEK